VQLVLGRGVAWPVWCWAVARSGAGASQGFSGVGQWRGVVLGRGVASLVLGSGEEWCWGVAGLLWCWAVVRSGAGALRGFCGVGQWSRGFSVVLRC